MGKRGACNVKGCGKVATCQRHSFDHHPKFCTLHAKEYDRLVEAQRNREREEGWRG